MLGIAAVWGGGQRRSVPVSEKPGHRRQQTQGQEGQAETALHLQRGAALHRGSAPASIQAVLFGIVPRTGRDQTLCTSCLLPSAHRGMNSLTRPSSLERIGPAQCRAFTSTTGRRGAATMPSERSWSLEWGNIWRSERKPLYLGTGALPFIVPWSVRCS